MGCSPLSRPIVRVRYPRCHSPCTYLRTLDLRQELGAGFALSLNGFGRILHAEQLNVSLIADNHALLHPHDVRRRHAPAQSAHIRARVTKPPDRGCGVHPSRHQYAGVRGEERPHTPGMYRDGTRGRRRSGRGMPATAATFEVETALATPRLTAGCLTTPCTQLVHKGDTISLIPTHRLNVSLDYHPLSWLTLSVTGSYVGHAGSSSRGSCRLTVCSILPTRPLAPLRRTPDARVPRLSAFSPPRRPSMSSPASATNSEP
jgi:hypothetical protein